MTKHKFLKLSLLFFFCFFLQGKLIAQYNNEWIDYTKTYYKFKVGASGLYRISSTTLNQQDFKIQMLRSFSCGEMVNKSHFSYLILSACLGQMILLNSMD